MVDTETAKLAQVFEDDVRLEPTLEAFSQISQKTVETIKGLRGLSAVARAAADAIDTRKATAKTIKGLPGLSDDDRDTAMATVNTNTKTGRPQEIETRLYLSLWDTYARLKKIENPKLSTRHNDPLYRFIGQCAKLIDPVIDFPKPTNFVSLMTPALKTVHPWSSSSSMSVWSHPGPPQVLHPYKKVFPE